MRRTRRPVVELMRHFLLSMFDGEWSSSRGQWTSVAVGIIAAALPAGMLMLRSASPMPQYAGKYRILGQLPTPDAFRATAVADQLALLVVLAAVTGLAALLVWQSLFPARRDYLALAALPIRPRQIFGARLAAVGIFATGLAVAVNLLPTLIAPFEYSGKWQKSSSTWTNLNAQAVAAGLECLFVLFAIVALQGILLNALPARWFVRVSVYVQGALFAVCATAVLRCWSIKDWDQARIERLPEFAWAPPVWFVGLHESLLGDADPFFAAMAGRALSSVGVAVGLAFLTYWLCYRRYRRLLIEAPDGTASRRLGWSFLAMLGRNPRQRAILTFMATTMARSRTHRFVWLAYVGFAVAIIFNSSVVNGAFLAKSRHPVIDAIQFLVLFWPLACSVVLLSGIRHVIRIPAELPANWIFRLNESHGRADWLAAADRFILLYALGPLYAFMVPVALYALPWEIAIRMLILQVLISLILFEALFYSWQQLPFACSYLPGRKPLVNIISSYVVTLGILVPMVSVMVAAASRVLFLFVVFGAGFLGGWLKLRSLRREGGAVPILYQDTASAPDLGIREISSRTLSSDPPSPPPLLRPAPSSGPHR